MPPADAAPREAPVADSRLARSGQLGLELLKVFNSIGRHYESLHIHLLADKFGKLRGLASRKRRPHSWRGPRSPGPAMLYQPVKNSVSRVAGVSPAWNTLVFGPARTRARRPATRIQRAASEDTCGTIPGPARQPARARRTLRTGAQPVTMLNSLGHFRRCCAWRFMAITGPSSDPTISSTGAVTSGRLSIARSGLPPARHDGPDGRRPLARGEQALAAPAPEPMSPTGSPATA